MPTPKVYDRLCEQRESLLELLRDAREALDLHWEVSCSIQIMNKSAMLSRIDSALEESN